MDQGTRTVFVLAHPELILCRHPTPASGSGARKVGSQEAAKSCPRAMLFEIRERSGWDSYNIQATPTTINLPTGDRLTMGTVDVASMCLRRPQWFNGRLSSTPSPRSARSVSGKLQGATPTASLR